MRWVLRGGRVVDPSQGLDRIADVVVEDGRIAEIAEPGAVSGDDSRDVTGCLVTPGLIDIHVHLREPGFEYKEDIASGTRAAAAGGFTAVCCMPNTRPPIDTPAVVRQILERAHEVGYARVYPVASLTCGMSGDQLTEIADLKAAGACAVSDDAFPVQNSETLRRGMEYCAQFGLTLMAHCEDQALTHGGAMNEGYTATVMGVPGIPAVAEEIGIARNILLAAETGCRLHLLHVSTACGAELLEWAKRKGWPVTGETAPHYLTLTDEACFGFDANAKMNPPLRTEADRRGLREALNRGVFDAIATDHAPHAVDEKEREFDRAPFGIVGLETCFGLVYTHLVLPGILTLQEAIRLLSTGPAEVLGLPGGSLRAGSPADISVFDLEAEWTVQPEAFRSKSRNTPFGGWRLQGRTVFTVLEGNVVAL